jgi:hypothetical protein
VSLIYDVQLVFEYEALSGLLQFLSDVEAVVGR